MKNPWMSLWLSAANRGAATARGYWLAEAERQQKAWMKAARKAMMSGNPPTRASSRRRRSPGD